MYKEIYHATVATDPHYIGNGEGGPVWGERFYVLVEFKDGGTNCVPSGAIAFGELCFDQSSTGLEVAAEDVLPEPIRNRFSGLGSGHG